MKYKQFFNTIKTQIYKTVPFFKNSSKDIVFANPILFSGQKGVFDSENKLQLKMLKTPQKFFSQDNMGWNNGDGDTKINPKDNLNGNLSNNTYDHSNPTITNHHNNYPEDNRAKYAHKMFEIYTTSIEKKDSNTQKILLEGYQNTLESEAFKPPIFKQEDNQSNSGNNTFNYISFAAGILSGGSIIGYIMYHLSPKESSDANLMQEIELMGGEEATPTDS